MHISCPECGTTFIVEDDVILNTSKKLKCSKCKHVWMYHESDLDAKRITDLPSISKIKTTLDLESAIQQHDNTPINKLLYIYPVIIGLLIVVLTSLINLQDNIVSCGISDALILKDIKLKNAWKDQKVVLNYRVHNNSDETQRLPLIRIRLFDKDSKVLKMHIIKDKRELKPGQFVNINTEFESIMHEANKVDVALGTWFDFAIW